MQHPTSTADARARSPRRASASGLRRLSAPRRTSRSGSSGHVLVEDSYIFDPESSRRPRGDVRPHPARGGEHRGGHKNSEAPPPRRHRTPTMRRSQAAANGPRPPDRGEMAGELDGRPDAKRTRSGYGFRGGPMEAKARLAAYAGGLRNDARPSRLQPVHSEPCRIAGSAGGPHPKGTRVPFLWASRSRPGNPSRPPGRWRVSVKRGRRPWAQPRPQSRP